ncbi:hypothetical protein [Salisediminibacterium halotolerans]|uniref:hypothetical protein n=1 Tax=Salisediminibacterium halotolerans TaxID=517425 RepID=UPI000EB14A5A|nr:hypothetical protein [Salisediminibacterium halotolerans]RLJ74255.1 hypothetical protein BCL39_1543 [Actinophytocola xinjiangensis]RPE87653.1 hypothetical protein EDD67_1389 [Salisediminibacterium halotolerans]TWG35092.1 hypothetical protein BCL52_1540 [Salisediminibacterium halotolerans]GEL06860.1 hypothetical protein SHA02_02760 [Salisediminibacterium halotolerans]
MIRSIIVTAACLGLLLTGCNDTPAEMDDAVAEFQGKLVKAEDVAYQYSLSEENIADYLKEAAVVSEARSLGIEVSEEEVKDHRDKMYPGLAEESETAFFEKQADVLNIEPEEYYDDWAYKFVERNMYMQLYVQEKFANPQTEEEFDQWSEKLEAHINELFADYKAAGDIVIY